MAIERLVEHFGVVADPRCRSAQRRLRPASSRVGPWLRPPRRLGAESRYPLRAAGRRGLSRLSDRLAAGRPAAPPARWAGWRRRARRGRAGRGAGRPPKGRGSAARCGTSRPPWPPRAGNTPIPARLMQGRADNGGPWGDPRGPTCARRHAGGHRSEHAPNAAEAPGGGPGGGRGQAARPWRRRRPLTRPRPSRPVPNRARLMGSGTGTPTPCGP